MDNNFFYYVEERVELAKPENKNNSVCVSDEVIGGVLVALFFLYFYLRFIAV